MGEIFSLKMLWTVIKDVRNGLSDRNENNIEALGAVRSAFNHTYNYLRNNQGAYEPNMELAELWNIASTKVMKVDKQLGELLGNKSRFWTHPDIYTELNRTVDIRTLVQITDEMERIQMRIR
jgi:hypothetical protein